MRFRNVVVFCLISAALLGIPAGVSGAPAAGQESQDAAATMGVNAAYTGVQTKDEIIYATLGEAGDIQSIYVVNQFKVASAGNYNDWGEYKSIENLTNTNPIAKEGDKVSFTADKGNFYYQGNMVSTDLPWVFEISYYLDGQKVEPQNLAGKSGNLEIQISSRQNEKIDPTFYENYMLQITVTLNSDNCSNIDAPDATVADAGQNKAVVYTILPNKDADYSLKTTVSEFSMTGIDISAVPYAMDVDFPDMDGQFDDLEQLPDAVSDLNDGVSELANGAHALKDGAGELKSGSASIQNGLNQLSGNSSDLLNASAQIDAALSQVSAALNSGSLSEIDLTQLAQLPQALSQLSEGLEGISGGLTDLKNGFVPAYAALDTAIQGIPAGTVTQEQIQTMYGQVDPGLQGAFGEMADTYSAAQTVKGTYTQVKAVFDAVEGTIDTLNGSIGEIAGSLSDMSVQIGSTLQGMDGLSELGELASGISELADNYGTFHAGLAGYMNGIKTLASNYSTFHAGLVAYEKGTGEFSGGIDELYQGTTEFKDETSDLPDQIQTEIDNMKEEYLPADFIPVSFTSSKNTDTGYVQFVCKTAGIDEPDKEDVEEPMQEENETFWDRMAALFEK